MAITSSTTSTLAWRLRWLSLILSGSPPRSVTIRARVSFHDGDGKGHDQAADSSNGHWESRGTRRRASVERAQGLRTEIVDVEHLGCSSKRLLETSARVRVKGPVGGNGRTTARKSDGVEDGGADLFQRGGVEGKVGREMRPGVRITNWACDQSRFGRDSTYQVT